jgi:hypothetical protein
MGVAIGNGVRWSEIIAKKLTAWKIPEADVTELDTLLGKATDCLQTMPGTEEDMPNSFFTRRTKDILVLPQRV